jgi:peptidyl-prolyl cis-trans isomerase C
MRGFVGIMRTMYFKTESLKRIFRISFRILPPINNKFKIQYLTFFLAFSLSACSSLFGSSGTPTPLLPRPTPVPPTATPPPLAATVNGEYISLAEYEAELARYKAAQTALGKTVSEEQASKNVLDDLIAQVLLAQAAREANFKITESSLDAREQVLSTQMGGVDALSTWKLDRGYTDASFRLALKRAVEAAWMRDKIVADVPDTAEQVHVRQILTYNEADARATLDRLNSGADFDELAAAYDPISRGELGWVPRGYLLDPKADEAVFALQPGEHSDVIATEAGYHIFNVIERANHPLSPDALLTLQEQALQKWLVERRAQSEVVLAP